MNEAVLTPEQLASFERDGFFVLLHGTLPHLSGPNRSAHPRHAYTLHAIDGVADYPEDNWLLRSPSLPLVGFDPAPVA
jgi:phytanoyl-CoA hydroxylase